MGKLDALFFKYPRICGAVMLAVGIGVCFHLKTVYEQGSQLPSKEIMTPPLFILIGLAGIVEPRLITVYDKRANPISPVYKVASIVMFVVAIGIGLYLKTVVFKDWKPSWAVQTMR